MSETDQTNRTVRAHEAAVELGKEWNDEIRADCFEVEIATGRQFKVDVADGELRIRKVDE